MCPAQTARIPHELERGDSSSPDWITITTIQNGFEGAMIEQA